LRVIALLAALATVAIRGDSVGVGSRTYDRSPAFPPSRDGVKTA